MRWNPLLQTFSIPAHISLIMFDLDGTLIDSRHDIAASVNHTFAALNLPLKPLETIYGYVGNGVRQLMIDAVASWDESQISRALAIFEQHYLAHLLDRTLLYPGLTDLLHRFRHIPKSMATNKPLHYTLKIIEGLGLTDQFNPILGGTTSCKLKPDPEMILTTLSMRGVKPEEALFVGDSPNDVIAAHAAGIRCCGVGYGGLTKREDIEAATPDFFVETVEELGAFLAHYTRSSSL